MGFHTFVSGEVLTAANVNSFLMNQAVITCTSGTHPSSPTAGFTIYETDTGNFSVYTGTAWVVIGVALTTGAWTAWTPTFTNCTSAAGTFNYRLINTKTIIVRAYFSGGTATAGGTIGVSLPNSLSTQVGVNQYVPGVNPSASLWLVGGTTVTSSGTFTLGQGLSGSGFTGTLEVT